MATIYAPATARGRAGIAVIRVSGDRAAEAAAALNAELPAPRRAALRRLATAELGVLDEALVLYFEPGASFTGEAVVEFHIHGSPAVMQAILSVLGRLEGFRLAEPGEFTRRALENERMDLAQVEGLGDLIQAETESQRRQAQRALSGVLGDRAEEWRQSLTRAAALLTAVIDFADEDVPVDVAPEVLERIDRVMVALETEIAGARAAERVREGFEVAVVGPPNVGKSTLLNALAGREAAITSSVAGTTRDVIEVQMDLAGLSVTLLDTAGLRETADVVEGMGVERALKRARAADLRVILSESDELPFGVTPEAGDIRVAAKADLGTCAEGLAVSGLSGEGIGALVDRIAQVCEDRASGAATITRERHVQAIGRALASLASAREHAAAAAMQAEFAADDLRGACRALDSLVGRVDVEHILDDVFASFCIGK